MLLILCPYLLRPKARAEGESRLNQEPAVPVDAGRGGALKIGMTDMRRSSRGPAHG